MSIAHDSSELRYTPEEYLARERQAESCSEFLDGAIYAMADPSFQHQAILTNVTGLLYPQLRGTPCQAFVGHVKVRTPGKRLFAYPDLLVVCGELQFHDEQRDVLTNPKVLLEILSPSTEDYDMGTKRLRYQNIPSLTDYVLVAQEEARVEHWGRQSDSRWLDETMRSLDQSLTLESINCTLPLAQIYERISFQDSP